MIFKRAFSLFLSLALLVGMLTVPAGAAENNESSVVTILTEEVTDQTNCLTVQLTSAPSAGFMRIFQLEQNEEFNSDSFFSYATLATVGYADFKVGELSVELEAKPAAGKPTLQLSAGDQVNHKTFGDGMVISVTPMGGDALIEVAFEQVGTKKLMLKTAGVHMTKK